MAVIKLLFWVGGILSESLTCQQTIFLRLAQTTSHKSNIIEICNNIKVINNKTYQEHIICILVGLV